MYHLSEKICALKTLLYAQYMKLSANYLFNAFIEIYLFIICLPINYTCKIIRYLYDENMSW